MYTVDSLLTDAPNSGLTRYSGHSSVYGYYTIYIRVLPNKGHSLNKGQRLSYQSVRYLESRLYINILEIIYLLA